MSSTTMSSTTTSPPTVTTPTTTPRTTTTITTTTTTPITTTTTPVVTTTEQPTTTDEMTTTSNFVTSLQTASALIVTRTVTSTDESVVQTSTLPYNSNNYDSTEITTTNYDSTETTTLPLAQLILSGKYHEVNPGQYNEVNPGQYNEINPGQYHEVNPGQYSEVHPGQDLNELEKSIPGQPEELQPQSRGFESPAPLRTADQSQAIVKKKPVKQSLNDVQVEVKQTENTKIYNVQSKVDKFIIGEYGTISKESGQTLQGVRYTAVADVSVDPNLIYETLIKFFPMHHHDEST